ncbi:peptidoglycan DD-metalloendopeptidase family protein [Mesorhizobium sp.]|uniref:M23 family metallopeptidase n=1 Tax=Mesorhizobium sp. TaxID=1871066 RepID=UPI0025ED8171|nr:peptidoglycan DD-metalloendopeptidase family protein [Mesorhizobium sp.]
MAKIIIIAACLLFAAFSTIAKADEDFCFNSPGILIPAKSGKGRVGDRRVYLPDMVFPIAVGGKNGLHAYCNSQVYGVGGSSSGKPGNVNSLQNYKMCWADDFCETRTWNMPFCGAGRGHQGVDCRPDQPTKTAMYEAVAFADATVVQVTTNTTVSLRTKDGTECRYLHLDQSSIRVRRGDQLRAGTTLGKVWNTMGGIPNTSIHLHFDCSKVVLIKGVPQRVFVPVYTSLIAAYGRAWNLSIPVKGGDLVDTDFERD